MKTRHSWTDEDIFALKDMCDSGLYSHEYLADVFDRSLNFLDETMRSRGIKNKHIKSRKDIPQFVDRQVKRPVSKLIHADGKVVKYGDI